MRQESGRSPKPFVIVFPDQLRGSALGFTGMEPVITPHIDKFACESLVLTNAVSNYPVSSPFRAMLMTGKYPLSNGVTGNCTSESAKYNIHLRETDTTWSDVLKSNGYSLGYIGNGISNHLMNRLLIAAIIKAI